jgi:hypothetical protein
LNLRLGRELRLPAYRIFISITASAELRVNATWSLLAKFDGEFASNSQTYAGTGTLRASW